MNHESNYLKYRRKCKEMSESFIKENPEFRLVRGYYFDPIWNRKEPHWWCEDKEGNIHDPTKLQFPSGGIKDFYTEFDGYFECAECGVKVKEENAVQMGNYVVCSSECAMKLVGL